MLNINAKKYLEVFIQKDRSYFIGDALTSEIRDVLRKNPELANVKVRLEFYTKRCSACGRELSPSMCYEHQGKTMCGTCKGAKNDFNDERARRFQL